MVHRGKLKPSVLRQPNTLACLKGGQQLNAQLPLMLAWRIVDSLSTRLPDLRIAPLTHL